MTSDADKLEQLLATTQELQTEVNDMNGVLKRFYIPRSEVNQKLVLVLAAVLAVTLVGAGFTIASYRQILANDEEALASQARIEYEQLRSELEVVEHRIADKQGRRCILDYIDAKIDSRDRGETETTRPDECGFALLPQLQEKLVQLEARLEEARERLPGQATPP